MRQSIKRREFLKSTATALVAPTVITKIASGQPAPSEQITLGCIGMGIHGAGWNLDAFLKIPEARVIAVCDVFRSRAANARQKVNNAYGNKDCQIYTDFREILARPDIDAVVISTPDHWHVLMSLMAARAGKDVFCEKPTLTIEEGQVLMDVIKETGVVYQGGIEDRSVVQYHRMAELVRNGALGKLHTIKVGLPAGELYAKEEPVPVPKGLDYDLWIGPAPFTPYTPNITGAQHWRNQLCFSGGKLTDWGAHLMDTAQVALFQEHGGPIAVEGAGEFPKDALSTAAIKYQLKYRYPNDVLMEVRSGGVGIIFEGSEGRIKCAGWRGPLETSVPDILEMVFKPEENKMWPRPVDEHHEFINGVKSRKAPYYSPEDIHRLSSAMHVGNIAMRLGRKLQWDPVKEEFPGDKAANNMRSRPMRKPWSLKG